MRYILLIVAIFLAMPTPAAMLDATGNLRVEPFSVNEVTRDCDMQGWFVVNNTVYMCTKIRENVSKLEIRAYIAEDNKREIKRIMDRDKWYKKWIKTDEGKAWRKEYDQKLLLDKNKRHK